MYLDLERVAHTLNLHYLTEGNKHCSPGWIQFACPYCGDGKYHLGYNLQNSYFNCWSCGSHPLFSTLALLSNLPERVIRETCKTYLKPSHNKLKSAKVDSSSTIKLPSNTVPFMKQHRAYMEARGFDADEVIKVWKLQGTSYWGEFPWRIVIPIYFGGRLVSYSLRAMNDTETLKYWTLEQDGGTSVRECLFGWDLLKKKKAVVVEGPMDAMRLGKGAVATLGVGYSAEQVNLLSLLDVVYIFFDADKAGRTRARRLTKKLSAITETNLIEIDCGDPGSMEQVEADRLMRGIGL